MMYRALAILLFGVGLVLPLAVWGGTPLTPAAKGLLQQYLGELRRTNPAYAGFDAGRGRTLYFSEHKAVEGDVRSCTTCHMRDPALKGRSDVGKPIEPLSPAANANRFQDSGEIEKWFRRNCRWVLGRTCTTEEKGDFLTFIFSL